MPRPKSKIATNVSIHFQTFIDKSIAITKEKGKVALNNVEIELNKKKMLHYGYLTFIRTMIIKEIKEISSSHMTIATLASSAAE